MKKKIALFLAAAMTLSAVPMTAFASTTNTISKIATVEADKPYSATLVLDEFKGQGTNEGQTIKLTLTGSEFQSGQFLGATLDDAIAAYKKAKGDTYTKTDRAEIVADATTDQTSGATDELKAAAKAVVDADKELKGNEAANTAYGQGIKFTKIGDKEAFVEFTAPNDDTKKVTIPILATAKDDGDSTVTIEATDAVVSAQTLKIANVQGGATTTTISGTTAIKETATKMKSIVITETTAGSLDKNAKIKVKLSNGFKWVDKADTEVVVFPSDCGINTTNAKFEIDDKDDQVAYITLTGESKKAATISLMNPYVMYDDDEAEIGDTCEATISEGGTTKQTITLGNAADYGVAFTIYKDAELPVFYSGDYDSDTDTLEVKIKENIAKSLIDGRKVKITFPEGVEVMGVDEKKADNVGKNVKYTVDENEVTLDGIETNDSKAEIRLTFNLAVDPEFTGDITATLSGSAVGDDQTLTVGKAEFPVKVDADTNELKIDYRNTKASDITLTEAEAGALKKDTTVSLKLDELKFDGTPTVEVTGGDLKIENVKTNSDGILTFDIKTESQKEAGVVKISNINLFMSRSLPAGDYDLKVVATKEATTNGSKGSDNGASHKNDYVKTLSKNAIFRTYVDKSDIDGAFDTDEVTVKKGYVTVVTAGRDQDDSTFTTQVKVTIGADKMYAGTKEIALDVPAYIANGYTMLPVRAVTEALSGAAIVRWDDASKTVTITFGQRVINMTVGSKSMVINGVNVAMQAACEITDSRAFIPLRDLGYALGLNDSKISWDDATKTATLN